MKSKHLVIEISIAAFVLMMLLWIMLPKFLRVQDYPMIEYFPDAVLRQAAKDKLGITKQHPFDESMLQRHAWNTDFGEFVLIGCDDLTGLRYFNSLRKLHLESDSLQMLHFGDYRNLSAFHIKAPSLELLNLSINSKLTSLYIDLDGSNRPRNKTFNFHVPNANSIISLTVMDYSNASIDLSPYPYINEIILVNHDPSGKGLQSLDLSKNEYLSRLRIEGHPIKTLDLSKQSELTHLYCSNNQLQEIKFAPNTRLQELECSNNQLDELNLQNTQQITTVKANGNPIQTIRFHNSSDLNEIYVDQKSITQETLDEINRYNIIIKSISNRGN